MTAAHIDNLFHPTATHVLAVRLGETYGLPTKRIAALDRVNLLRTAATLDFLSNNLPAGSDTAWMDAVLPVAPSRS